MIFDEINHLREDPHSYADKLLNEFPHYKDRNIRHRPGTVPVYTREGIKAISEAHTELLNLDPLPPLHYSIGLSSAAVSHCLDTGALGIVGHIGSQETSLQERIEKHGKWSGNIIEALDYGSVSGFEVVLSLLVDDGLTTRPHRKALLNPNFTKIGVGAGPHSEFKTVACVIFSAYYEEFDHVEIEHVSEELVPLNPEIEDWMEGAVKVTCEVREDVEKGRKIKRIKKHWQMADGSIRTVDEVFREEEGKREKHESLGGDKGDEKLVRELRGELVGEHVGRIEEHLGEREHGHREEQGKVHGGGDKIIEIHHSEAHFGIDVNLRVDHKEGVHVEETKHHEREISGELTHSSERNLEAKNNEGHGHKDSESSGRLSVNVISEGKPHDSEGSDSKTKKKGKKHEKKTSSPTDSPSSKSSDDQ